MMIARRLSVGAGGKTLGLVSASLVALSLSLNVQARTLDTAYGEVEVNDDPERVVTLYEGALDTALVAGVTPLGAVATRGGQSVANYLQDDVPDIHIVGLVSELNIEQIVALQPDLILASSRLPKEQYELLSQLAPTVVPNTQGLAPDAWKGEARLFGDALGQRDKVEEAITAVEERATELQDKVAAAGPKGAHLVRWMPRGPLVMSTQLFSTGLLSAAGFDVSDEGLVKQGRPHSDPLSLEALSQIDGDWLFLATLNEDGEQALATAKDSDAFRRLSVVENDRAVPVDGQLWTSASGPMAAQAVLDDIAAAIEGASQL